jgi:hypothetical protein
VFLLAWGLLVWASLPSNLRWREESADRRVALAVDWNEYRDFNARLAASDEAMFRELRAGGVTVLVINPLTLIDLLEQRRVQPIGPNSGADPLDAQRLRVFDPALARQLTTQWSWRNVSGLQAKSEGKTVMISRKLGFVALKDGEVGFDTALVRKVRAAGLTPVLRISSDPWLADDKFDAWQAALPAAEPQLGVLFSSDELPGGLGRAALWRSWLRHNQVIQFLPEFRPAMSAWQMAKAFPQNAYRAHSIPATELKDLKPDAALARWHRAVEERACRLLLVRMAANDSKESFLAFLSALNDRLERHRWRMAFPLPRVSWGAVTRFQRMISPLASFGVVCLAPWVGLSWAWLAMPRWKTAFLRVVLGCLAGALIAAAIAQTPLTRIEVLPFRGVKWAFVFSWSVLVVLLYPLAELRWKLTQHLRRSDLLIGGLALAALGYLMLRTGNAAAGWKPAWEQGVRQLLETALIARPRFKEFAIGYPILWAGCYIQSLYQRRQTVWDGRVWIWIGMIGPISMINTFCHLHSPLRLELFRSLNGVVIGVALGSLAILALRRPLNSKHQTAFSFAREDRALNYERSS